jgi:hypothetical protein
MTATHKFQIPTVSSDLTISEDRRLISSVPHPVCWTLVGDIRV